MRRILVDSARRNRALKRGGGRATAPVDLAVLAAAKIEGDSWIDLDETLAALKTIDTNAANIAKLRLFAGLPTEEAGATSGMIRATAFRSWSYARAWLTAALS